MTDSLRSIGSYYIGKKSSNIKRSFQAHKAKRYMQADRLFNRKVYEADYLGRKLHVDQNENLHLKLVMHDETHVVARNGYSGMITGYTKMAIKND